jgi:hypothetical protein
MNAETLAAVRRVIDQAARLAELRDRYAGEMADDLARHAVTYGHAAAYAAEADLCDVATALAPSWGGNDIRTDRAGYAARLAEILLPPEPSPCTHPGIAGRCWSCEP